MTGWANLDPLVRALRAIAVVSFIGMLWVTVADPDRANNGQLLVLLFGSILVALGYPIVMRLPASFGRKEPPNGD